MKKETHWRQWKQHKKTVGQKCQLIDERRGIYSHAKNFVVVMPI